MAHDTVLDTRHGKKQKVDRERDGLRYKGRIRATLLILMLLIAALGMRITYLQVVRGEHFQEMAEQQWTKNLPIDAKRGNITDRNGTVLAQNATAYSVSVTPKEVKNPTVLAEELARMLELETSAVLSKVTQVSSSVYIKHFITKEQETELRDRLSRDQQLAKDQRQLTGVRLVERTRRYYPMKSLMSQALGFTNVDGVGQEGLELALDKYLGGVKGSVSYETDLAGNELPYSVSRRVVPQDGLQVMTTLDYVIQSTVENQLRKVLEETQANWVGAIVMDPRDASIYSVVSLPDFDPNEPPRNDPAVYKQVVRNRMITDVYEPGSTFKIFTSAAGLDSGIVTPETHFYCAGHEIVDGQRIKCWRSANPHGDQTFAKGVENSCNPVFMKVGEKLGRDRFYQYIKAFGFGQLTGVELTGEEKGIVTPVSRVRNVDLACISFGQSIAVTPLQLANAACAAVNGGTLYSPRLVKEIRDADGNVVETVQPVVLGHPITADTSAVLRGLLEGVVVNGSGKQAQVAGYRVGGKTGTSQKYVDGKILTDRHVASFLGFAPADNPQVLVLVIVDEPQVAVDFGSVVAAPVVGAILSDVLRYLEIPPMDTENSTELADVPDVTYKTLEEAQTLLTQAGFQNVVEGNGKQVVDQMPKPQAPLAKGGVVVVYMGDEPPDDGSLVYVPDVMNKSVVQSHTILQAQGLTLKVVGSGLAVSQNPAVGELVPRDTTVTVTFQLPVTPVPTPSAPPEQTESPDE